MTDQRTSGILAGPFTMLLSAAIFGYFGFLMFTPKNTAGQVVPMFALEVWTLRGASVGFVLSACVTFASLRNGNAIYSIVSILTGLSFISLAIWDVVDKQYTLPSIPFVPPALLFLVLGLWFGYSSAMSLKFVLSSGGKPD